LVYAALLLTEGIGLLLRRRWAEYFSVVAVAFKKTLEVYELTRRLTWGASSSSASMLRWSGT